MDLITLIPSTLAILIAALYVLGTGLKKTEMVPDKYIPAFLLVFAIVFSILLVGISATSILQGILCWGVSIGINQTVKQLNKEY